MPTDPIIFYCKESHIPEMRIERVDIGLISAEEIERRSVVHVSEANIYDKSVPRKNGPNDHRMGVVDRRMRCGTCGHRVDRCQGHEGHIKLAYPVYHVRFTDLVLKMLRCVCFWCSNLLIDVNKNQKARRIIEQDRGMERFQLLTKVHPDIMYKEVAFCACCGGVQPNYNRKGGPLNIQADFSKAKNLIAERGGQVLSVTVAANANSSAVDAQSPSSSAQQTQINFQIPHALTSEDEEVMNKPFTARQAKIILDQVPDDVYSILGFGPLMSHPKNSIMTVMPVVPPTVRPSIVETEGSRTRGQDDLTHKYQDIIKANNDLIKFAKQYNFDIMKNDLDDFCDVVAKVANGIAEEKARTDFLKLAYTKVERLQDEVAAFIDNEVRGQKKSVQRSGAPTVSLSKRLKSKEGRIRGNLMGKRHVEALLFLCYSIVLC